MFLSILLSASIQGGLLILLLLAGLKMLPSISPKIRVWLWRLVFLKMAVSFLPVGVISLNILPPEAPPAINDLAISSDGAQIPVHRSPDPWIWAWAAGFTVAGVLSLCRYRTCRDVIEHAFDARGDRLQNTVEDLSGILRVKHHPRVYISNDVSTAVVVGSREPAIVLPQDILDSEDLRLVLAHEIAHVCHRDPEWNVLASFVNCLFFFHPLVWLATRAAQQAQEAAADAAAIRVTNASPKRYGEMLVRATIDQLPSFSPGLSVGAPTNHIRKRLEELKYVNARPTIVRIIAASALTGIVIALTPAYQLAARQAVESAQDSFAPKAVLMAQTAPGHLRAARAEQGVKHPRRAAKRHSARAQHRAYASRTVRGYSYSYSYSTSVAPTPAVAITASVAPQGLSTPPTPAMAPTRASAAAMTVVAPAKAVSSSAPAAVQVLAPSTAHAAAAGVSVAISSEGAVAPAALVPTTVRVSTAKGARVRPARARGTAHGSGTGRGGGSANAPQGGSSASSSSGN